jgi:hypothetical protein
MTSEYPVFLEVLPSRALAFPLPGVPSRPFTHTRVADLSLMPLTVILMLRAISWPGPAPVRPALAIALVESECMVMCRCSTPRNQATTRLMAASSALNGLFILIARQNKGVIPKGYVPKAKQTKEKKFSHRHKKSTALHGCAVRKSRGQEYPLTICRKEKKKTDERLVKSAVAPGGYSIILPEFSHATHSSILAA